MDDSALADIKSLIADATEIVLVVGLGHVKLIRSQMDTSAAAG
jgi:pheromone shutdown protein TraB